MKKVFFYCLSIVSLAFILPTVSMGHGDDKPGPHGGYIKMPGAYHTELVFEKEYNFYFYLLDANFQSPIVIDSSIDVVFKTSDLEIPQSCKPKEIYFLCVMPEGVTAATLNKIVVKSKRANKVGRDVVYGFPLHF